MKPSRRFATFLILAQFCCLGCGETEPTVPLDYHFAFPIGVMVKDLENNRISKVPVMLNGRIVGHTDRLGIFKMEYWELEGTEVEIALGEVSGYRPVSEVVRRETLEKTTGETNYIPVPIVISAQYEMIRKEYFFWIHAKCDKTLRPSSCRSNPVTLNGKEVARTESDGYAEFLLSEIPGQSVTIQIETPKDQFGGEDAIAIIPANPTYSVKLDKEPHVYLIEQTFADRLGGEKSPKRGSSTRRDQKKKRRTKRRPKRRKQRKKPKPSGVIDLF